MKTAQIVSGIRTILEDLLENSLKKAEKLTLIDGSSELSVVGGI